ncbi:MAG: hypothetical protein K2M00_00160, partial [Muribaculaceae bacterium]|nr:hypothetical protein [Muribaculaceae bacterium]
LPDVKCPVTAILSAKDEMVSLASRNILGRLPSVKVTILPDSTHYYYSGQDLETIYMEFKKMLTDLGD